VIVWCGGVARSSVSVLAAFVALAEVSVTFKKAKKIASSSSSSVVDVVVGFVVVVVVAW